MPRRRNINRDLKERRERKYRLRGRTHRFIPDKDSDFACMGRRFANHVADHAERLGVVPEVWITHCLARSRNRFA